MESAKNLLLRLLYEGGEKNGIISPTFCHGYSGLLYTAILMENPNADVLADRMRSFYSQDNLFGFKDIEYSSTGLKRMNKAGFLDGTTGVLLTLLSYWNQKNYTDWDTLFLLN